MLSFKFQSPSFKIEDFQINPINTFSPISNKGEASFFKPITRKFLYSVLDVKFQVSGF